MAETAKHINSDRPEVSTTLMNRYHERRKQERKHSAIIATFLNSRFRYQIVIESAQQCWGRSDAKHFSVMQHMTVHVNPCLLVSYKAVGARCIRGPDVLK